MKPTGFEQTGPPAVISPVAIETISLLYQGMLTSIVRVRSGKPIADAVAFRKGMLDTVKEIEREAGRRGYRSKLVEDATYATVAFLDETIQNSSDVQRSQWSPLQAEFFGKTVAGEGFFERLDQLQRQPNAAQLAETLEVFLLCLLLGYRGRYGKVAPGELRNVIENLRERIESIKGYNDRLSPAGIPVRQQAATVPPSSPDRNTTRMAWIGIVFLVSVLAFWIVFRIELGGKLDAILRGLQLS